MQRPAFKLWQQTHDRAALAAFDYKPRTSILRQVLIFAGIAVVVGGLLYFEVRPRGFEGGGLSLDYPGVWSVYPHDNLNPCSDGVCVVVLVRDTPASVSSTIWVYHYSTGYPDSQALRDAAWDYTLETAYPDATLIEGKSLTVGGYPAAGHTYHATNSDAYCDEQAYLEDVYVVVNGGPTSCNCGRPAARRSSASGRSSTPCWTASSSASDGSRCGRINRRSSGPRRKDGRSYVQKNGGGIASIPPPL